MLPSSGLLSGSLVSGLLSVELEELSVELDELLDELLLEEELSVELEELLDEELLLDEDELSVELEELSVELEELSVELEELLDEELLEELLSVELEELLDEELVDELSEPLDEEFSLFELHAVSETAISTAAKIAEIFFIFFSFTVLFNLRIFHKPSTCFRFHQTRA